MAEPAWFTTAVDQVLSMIEAPAKSGTYELVMVPLTDKGEFNCDLCGKDCEQTGMTIGQKNVVHKSGTHVLIVFGVCAEHRAGFD